MGEIDEQNLSKIYKYCAYQDRCTYEVIQKMKELEVDVSKFDIFIQHLEEEGFLDEQRYITSFVRGKFFRKKWGKRKIIFELKAKQIPSAQVLKVIDQEIREEDYLNTIITLAEHKYVSLTDTSEPLKKHKTLRYLLQKGFEHEQIYPIVMKLSEA